MDDETFHRYVLDVGGLDRTAQAAVATDAVMGALGERLDPDTLHDVAAQLPGGVADALTEADDGRAHTVGVRKFRRRVATRADVGEDEANRYVEAVAAALGYALSDGQMQELRDALPDEYDRVFAGTEAGEGAR